MAGHAQDELKKGQDLLATYVRAIKQAGGDVNLETGEITGEFSPPIDFSIPDWVPILGGFNPDTEATAKFKSDTSAGANTYANMTNNWAEAGQPTKKLFEITASPVENTTAKVQSQVSDVVARVNATKEILGMKKPTVQIQEQDATR
jgi:hypothetical protein